MGSIGRRRGTGHGRRGRDDRALVLLGAGAGPAVYNARRLRLGFLGYLLNFVSVGSVGGDLFKAVFVAREYPGRRAQAVATVVLDRIVGLFAMFVVASAALLLTGQLQRAGPELRIICQMTLVVTGVATAGIAVVLLPGFTTGALSEFIRQLPKVGPTLSRLIDALRLYRRQLRVLACALLLSFGVHGLPRAGCTWRRGDCPDRRRRSPRISWRSRWPTSPDCCRCR